MLVRLLLSTTLALTTVEATAEAPVAPNTATLDGLAARVSAAWAARDLAGYFALWGPARMETLVAEQAEVRALFAGEECRLDVRRVSEPLGTIEGQAFCVKEPRAFVAYTRLRCEHTADGWRVVGRDAFGQVDGLIHIALDPQGQRADGRVLRFEDFELRMERGVLFRSAGDVGATALAFLGEGLVRMTPRPAAEREQLRLYCGRPALETRVHEVLVRVDPLDLERVLTPLDDARAPDAAGVLPRAQALLTRHATEGYVLDAALPRSPWWTLPPSGSSVVVFDTPRGPLTYAVTTQPEAITLFDRTRHRQICLYPAVAQPADYHEDDANDFDVLRHDLHVRLDAGREDLEVEDAVRLRVLSGGSTIRLRLDRALNVESITSEQGVPLLFLRVPSQDLLVLVLDDATRAEAEITLTVRYSGALREAQREAEALQFLHEESEDKERRPELRLLSNDPPWYPRAEHADYATFRLTTDLPEGLAAVSSGRRTGLSHEGRRVVTDYVQELPSRYLALVLGELDEVPNPRPGDPELHGFGTPTTRGEVGGLLERARNVLSYFESLFGACPYSSINLVVSEGPTPSGHSPPGLTLLSLRGPFRGTWRSNDPGDFSDVPDFVLAHELAHQWWGHGVAPANYHERWLSEGFAHYAAALWVERSRGERAFGDVVGRMARWALREGAQGPLSLGQRVGHVRNDPRAYRAVVYDKGAIVLHMLRRQLGDAAFFAGLRAFQERCRFRTATTRELQLTLEAMAERPLGEFFAQWLSTTTTPELMWSDRVERGAQGYVTTVTLRAEGLPRATPLEVRLTFEGEQPPLRQRVVLEPGGGVLTFTTATRPRQVTLNGDWGLLARVSRRKRVTR